MAFELPPLPYAEDALEPDYSARTISFHYGKHHKTYVDTLNKLMVGTDLEGQTLEAVILAVAGKPDKQPVFNNAAQVWNHTFFWNSMKPGGGGAPTGELGDEIAAAFGGHAEFVEAFKAAAAGRFGSGWVWLVADLSLIHISEPTRLLSISYAVFCLKQKKNKTNDQPLTPRNTKPLFINLNKSNS